MGKAQKYVVRLTNEDQKELEKIVSKGKHSVRVVKRAQVLLKANTPSGNGKPPKDQDLAKEVRLSQATVQNIRERYCKEGLKRIYDKPRPGQPSKIDGDLEAKMTAIACSEAPKGKGKWTLRMIADKLVELEYIDDISHVAVYHRLKKTSLNRG